MAALVPPSSGEASPGTAGRLADGLWALGCRRAFVLILAPSALVFALEGIFEADKWTHILDDEMVAIVAVVALVYFYVNRKAVSPSELARGNRLATIAGALIVVSAVLAFVTEGNDPMDIGNDPAAFLLGLFVVFNGYVTFGSAEGVPPGELPLFTKELGRLRGTVPSFAFLLVAGIYFTVGSFYYPVSVGGAFSTLGLILTVVGVVVAFAGIGLLALSRKLRNVPSLHQRNDLLALLGALLVVLAVVTGTFPVIIFASPLVVNRFV